MALTYSPDAHYCAAHPTRRPPLCRLPRRASRQRRDNARRARAPRHQAACLHRLATTTPRVISSAPPRPPGPPCSLPLPRSPPLSRSHTHGRMPPPPFAIAVTAAILEPLRHAHELRLVPLFLLTEPPDAGSPCTSQAPPFPSSATGDRRRRFAASGASLELAVCSNRLLVSSSSLPLTLCT